MKKILIGIVLCFLSLHSFAQNFEFGAVTHADFDFDRNTIDSNANAVVLKEYGTTSFYLDDATGRLVLIFEYHTRIKINNKEGFKQANIVIPIHKSDGAEELILDLNASTFNRNQSGFVQSQMDKKAMFTENRSKYVSLVKFTLPNIKEGSIIEYSYRLQTPFLFNYRTWEFQSDIPKVYSEYVAFIPGNYNYNVSLRGFYKLSDQKSEISKECLRLSGTPVDCSKMTYIMKNIPAFVEEDYMTAPSNFRSAIYFELADVIAMSGAKQSLTKTWRDVDYELTNDKNFGSQMKRKDVFKDLIPTLTKDAPDELSKAKAIYNYIKKQIKWNNYYGKYSEGNIKAVLENRSGNVADINFSLIAALSAANLDAEAVILSTRENGTVNKLFPVISDFNYVVAKVNIDGTSYLLDASEPLLPFGLLPLRCINDQGRVINLKKPSYWIDLKASQKSVTNYVLIGKLEADGKIKGTITTTTYGYDAFNKRKEIKRYNSIDEYVEKIDESMPKFSINKHQILAVDSVEKPLVEVYEVEFAAHNGASNNQLYINPFFINKISKKPFNLNERTYPVDLGSASDQKISVMISLPGKYEMLEKPKDIAIALPASGGRYIIQSDMVDDKLTVNQILQFNKAIYSPEEYLYLKEFYSKIIQNQKTDVLLKKAD
ncbi:transglutaminase domain-containing protein [Pedobacter sp. KR3-3]|uniref:Transglutaminase domain-containing protein n=1 Tax=Pedobacter albus TaxID=3113905 RepID=A0ABU7I4M9_9SPHI|nr:transglutaminase domain-containing protein [Pedobacter sp. KR3-3]MEE1944410.1 transglutaminase domain-containing protein [Pedobacter sp. KR3-3]